jgi:hypothetical protein
MNILVFPCGSEIGLEVYNSLFCQKDINLIGVNSVNDNGRFVYQNYIGNAPYIDDDNFIEFFKKIVEIHDIDYIIPAMDIAIYKLKKYEKELNCCVLSSPIETLEIIRKKSSTYEFLKDKILTPKIINEKNVYPIFSKPDIGSSSRNTIKIESDIDFEYAKNKFPNNILLEYLPGEEYTIDCFTDKNGDLKFVEARIRSRIHNGISVETNIIKDKKIFEIAKIINKNLILDGSWFFQLKKNINDEYCLLEIASRFAGSSVINRLRGINFSYLNILNQTGDIEIIKNDFSIVLGRALDIKTITNINYENVYIDYDDTLIIKNKVNTDALKFLYKCLNENKNIFLITKHDGSILDSLKKFKIDQCIFSKIIQIKKTENKADYINPINSIFIDDSFSERKNILKTLKIPVISVENITML